MFIGVESKFLWDGGDISFKNDCKIKQSLAEFEMHAIDSLNYSLLIPI